MTAMSPPSLFLAPHIVEPDPSANLAGLPLAGVPGVNSGAPRPPPLRAGRPTVPAAARASASGSGAPLPPALPLVGGPDTRRATRSPTR